MTDPVTPELLAKARAKVKEARAAGFSDPEIDEYLKGEIGQGLSQVMDPTARDYLRAGASGATLGFNDEIAGLMAAIVPGGKDYKTMRDEVRGNQSGAEYVAPKRMMAAELVGGLLPAIATAGAGSAGAAAGAGSKALQAVKISGLLGGASGLGHSDADNIAGMAKDTAIGAGVGAAAGGALSLGTSAGGRAIGAIADRLNPSRAVTRAVATQIPDNAAATIARQETLAPGTAVLADLSPEMTAMTRVVGADAETGVTARVAAEGRKDALKQARNALGPRYDALQRAIPVDDALRDILRKANENVSGNETDFLRLQRIRSDLRADIKVARRPNVKRELGDIERDLTEWISARVPEAEKLDADYKFLSGRLKNADDLLKEVTGSSKNYAGHSVGGVQAGSVGGSLPQGARGMVQFVADALGPDRAARARAVNQLLLTPGDATKTALEAITKARSKSSAPPAYIERLIRAGLLGDAIPAMAGRTPSLLSP